MDNYILRQFGLILTFLFLSNCDLKSSEDYRREANLLEKQKKYKESISILDKAIEKDPKNLKALIDRGVDKSIIKDYKGAIDDYTKVLEIDPDNGLAFLNRGKNKERMEYYTGAIIDFDSAIRTKGNEIIYLNKVENPFVETGFEFDVSMEEIKFERGIAFYNIDSLKKAFNDFNFSIKKNFALSDSYYWRGLIYLRYKMKDEGCADLLKSKELGDSDAADLIEKYCK